MKFIYTVIGATLLALIALSNSGCSDHIMFVSGPKGDAGVSGNIGPMGPPGTSCFVVSTPGGATVNCSDGSTASILNGLNGNNGASGIQISIVQFCAGVTSYPTTFVEVGFCISNELWAVYSESNGFMVKVPPGTYQSHAHNSSCTFTVAPNCVIIN